MLNWTEEFDTGQPLLDAQHRLLISYINRLELFTRVSNPSPEEVDLFSRVLEALEKHAVTHFKNEEACLRRFQCAAHDEIHRAHTEFLQFYRIFLERLRFEGCRPELVLELHQACTSWIQQHITSIDSQLQAFADADGLSN